MHCGKKNIGKLEQINKRALKFVNKDYDSDYETQLMKADKNSLLHNRIMNMCTEVYKVRIGIMPV